MLLDGKSDRCCVLLVPAGPKGDRGYKGEQGETGITRGTISSSTAESESFLIFLQMNFQFNLTQSPLNVNLSFFFKLKTFYLSCKLSDIAVVIDKYLEVFFVYLVICLHVAAH